MNAIATLSPKERGQIFTEAGARLGFAPFHVEKDLWVCWTLATLFGDGRIGENLAFRGGTSLSKGWQCIERFSEDIDLAINRSWMGGDELVEFKEVSVTTSERERRYKRLREQCRGDRGCHRAAPDRSLGGDFGLKQRTGRHGEHCVRPRSLRGAG